MSARPTYVYVTPFFPSPGAHFGSFSYDFVRALERNSGYDVRVFVPGNGEDYDFGGVAVHRFPVRSLPSAVLPLLFARRNAESFLAALARAGIDARNVAVCHGNTAAFAVYPLAVKAANPQCLTLLHHHDLAGVGLRLGRLRHFWPHKVLNFAMLRRALERIDCHVFVSGAAERSFLSFPDTSWSCYGDYRRLGRGMGWMRPVAARRTEVLWNGVDTGLFRRDGAKRRGGGSFTVGCVGNFVDVKDHASLVRAAALLKGRIPGLRVELLGTNGIKSVAAAVRAEIAANGLQDTVEITEHVEHSRLPEAYRRWDLFAMPSVFEGLGCVYLESWCCGTPFIACRGQGIEETLAVEDRGLWLCRPYDPSDLAEKIHSYWENRPEQKLSGPVDIDVLVRGFAEKIGRMRREM